MLGRSTVLPWRSAGEASRCGEVSDSFDCATLDVIIPAEPPLGKTALLPLFQSVRMPLRFADAVPVR